MPTIDQMRRQLEAAGINLPTGITDDQITALWQIRTPGATQGQPGVEPTAMTEEGRSLLTEASEAGVSEQTVSEIQTLLTGGAAVGSAGPVRSAKDLLARAKAGEGIFKERQQTQQTIDLLRDQPGRKQVVFAPNINATSLLGE